MNFFYCGTHALNNYLKNQTINQNSLHTNALTDQLNLPLLPNLQNLISKALELQEQIPQIQPYEINSFWKKLRLRLMGISQVYTLLGEPYYQTLQYHDLSEETDFQEIKKNLQIAEQINRVIHSTLQIISPNFPIRKTGLWKESKDIEGIITPSKLEDLENAHESIRKFKDTNKILKESIRKKIGNCGELTLLAYCTIRHAYPQTSVKYMGIANGDHGFLIIGSDCNQIILDVWANAFFTLTEKTWFSSYLGMEVNEKTCKTIIEKITTTSRLITRFSFEETNNLHSLEEFPLKDDSEIASVLTQKLKL